MSKTTLSSEERKRRKILNLRKKIVKEIADHKKRMDKLSQDYLREVGIWKR